MNIQTTTRKACAVYCCVSSDEGLGQEFNSIDAQKEAGQAFIASQRSEGWIAIKESYDDGGFSGGTMERPALKRLLADISNGKIAIVVVYKIDRLTRSLADFSKIVEVLERHGVSFVSVTQQFNTTSSMGRLMLNILLSFAQFEREVTGERVRDKIAAAKKKGMWMGGMPPLGYDVVNRKLVINGKEAAILRRIFEEVLRVSSLIAIAAQLNAEGITTKAWTTQDGRVHLGRKIDRKYIYILLRKRIYRGEISHKGHWYPGEHPAIIDQALWDAVQACLNSRNKYPRVSKRKPSEALLRGLLYNAAGERIVPTYTRKPTKTYRYYVSQSVMHSGSAQGDRHARVPANEIEAAVIAQIFTVFSSPEAIVAVVAQGQYTEPVIDEATVVIALGRLRTIWEQLLPSEHYRIVTLLIERVDLVDRDRQYGIGIIWRPLGWRQLIGEFRSQGIEAERLDIAV